MSDPKWRGETSPGSIAGWIAIAILIPFLIGIYSTTWKRKQTGEPGLLEEPRQMIQRTSADVARVQRSAAKTQPATISTTGSTPQAF